jgi:hypothetical protein
LVQGVECRGLEADPIEQTREHLGVTEVDQNALALGDMKA